MTKSFGFELLESAQRGDKEAAEQLIIENSGLIWSIARRYFGRGVDGDDLYQLGCVGFLNQGKTRLTYKVFHLGSENIR